MSHQGNQSPGNTCKYRALTRSEHTSEELEPLNRDETVDISLSITHRETSTSYRTDTHSTMSLESEETESKTNEECSRTLTLQAQVLLETSMCEFYLMFTPKWKNDGLCILDCNDEDNSSSSVSEKCQVQSPNTISRTHKSGVNSNKKSRGERECDHEDEEDESQRKRPKNYQSLTGSLDIPLRFACPFYKRDPRTHCRLSSCAGPGFKSVSRMKYAYSRPRLPNKSLSNLKHQGAFIQMPFVSALMCEVRSCFPKPARSRQPYRE
jgi:hypothetical protein